MEKEYSVEWAPKLADYHVIIVTNSKGARSVHSSKDRRYLEKLITQRYSSPLRAKF